MCGILGIVGDNAIKNKANLDLMINSLFHRGPDTHGSFISDNCIFGHTRFSIVDLVSGDQPMSTSDGRFSITFNGEIYGYKDLKSRYEYNYLTSSDTELILAMYEHDDLKMFENLNGMFAFAIWDKNEKKMIAGRDRFGEKPFYYSITDNGNLIFASELKAILASGLIKPRISINALNHYLRFLTTPSDASIFENIFVLPAGHYLIWNNQKLTIKPYWSPDKTIVDISLSDAKNEFERLFCQSIQRQLVADVPVGAFLSGGLDSSTVVAIASEYKKGIETFSFGFGDDINELPFAKAVAERYGTVHHELNATDYNIADILLKMVDIYDEPFADSSNIPTYLISQFSGKNIKVILTGDGGDELLGGYDNYRHFLMKEGGYLQRRLSNYFYRFFKKITKSNRWNDLIGATNFWEGMNYDDYLNTRSYFSNREIDNIVIKKMSQVVNNSKLLSVDDLMRCDILNSFTADMLVKTDRAAMAVPIELRSPFLDKDVANFCLSLPNKFKVNEKQGKLLLRQTFGHLWPSEIVDRPKQGFGAPVDKWLKIPAVQNLVNEFLGDDQKSIFKYLDFNNVQNFRNKNNYQTWIILVLSLWFEKWGKYAE